MDKNMVQAIFRGSRMARTRSLYQYDYGMTLQIVGVELPAAYEVHFADAPTGESMTVIGGEDGVAIPDELLTGGGAIYAWLYIHTGADDGETILSITIPVQARAAITGAEPTPVQQDVITQAIAALQDGVETVEGIAESMPQAIADALQAAKDSGEFDGPQGETGPQGERGPKGDTGDRGPAGQDGAAGADGKDGADGSPGIPGKDGKDGADGVSPTIAVSEITGGHRLTITDATGASTVDILDGEDGSPGAPGSPGTPGEKGDPGDDYVLTQQDKADIAALVTGFVASSTVTTIWTGTQAQYEQLTPDAHTLYLITEV